MWTSSPLPPKPRRAIRSIALGAWLAAFAAPAVVVAAPARASGSVASETVQPAWGASGLYLELGGQIPLVKRSNGQRSPVPVRAGERIRGFVELSPGWIATGAKPFPPRGAYLEPSGHARDLLLIAGGDGPTRRLPVPRVTTGTLRGGATPVHADGTLVGLVWLEGDDPRALSVMAADWTGFSWGPPTVVSPPGPGSQMAPSVTVAADGTWFAAWSRFDGRDDEIYWSERRGANWSDPQRAHARHAGPDVAPALSRHGDEILLAWSRYDDGSYDAVLARHTNGRWLAPNRIGPRQTAFPTFRRSDDTTYVLYQNLAPAGWSVVEMTGSGSVTRRAAHRTDDAALANRRPLVLEASAGGPRLSWPATKDVDLVWGAVP